MPRIRLTTANPPITIAPQKTALLIIDMRNVWLSQPLCPRGPGHNAEDVLLKYGIPAARSARIQIVRLEWRMSQDDLPNSSQITTRMFGFRPDGICQLDKGSGHDIGILKLANDAMVQAGRCLMREKWNAELHGPLEAECQKGLLHLMCGFTKCPACAIRLQNAPDILREMVSRLSSLLVSILMLQGISRGSTAYHAVAVIELIKRL